MKFFLAVLGLVMIVEGLPYFAFPEKMQEFLKQLMEIPPEKLRWLGLFLMLAGLLLCYMSKRIGIAT